MVKIPAPCSFRHCSLSLAAACLTCALSESLHVIVERHQFVSTAVMVIAIFLTFTLYLDPFKMREFC